MRGDDKSVRSSLAVSEVLGELSGNELSRTIQEKCGAGHLRVDASSKKIDTLTERFHGRSAEVRFLTAGSFTIAEDTKPRVINLDFPALPAGVARSQKLVENGIDHRILLLCYVINAFRRLPRFCS